MDCKKVRYLFYKQRDELFARDFLHDLQYREGLDYYRDSGDSKYHMRSSKAKLV